MGRGHLQRGVAHHDWLRRVHRVFGGRLDLEWVRPEGSPTPLLLQARPALFPVRRNETLSLANHKEILGESPSPWIVGAFVEAGRMAMTYYERVEPAVAGWGESYGLEAAERVWMNFALQFRLMDHWGLPRRMVTDSVGGLAEGPEDGRVLLGRLFRKLPALARAALVDYATIFGRNRELLALDATIDGARSLLDLQRATAIGADIAIRVNTALMQILAIAAKAPSASRPAGVGPGRDAHDDGRIRRPGRAADRRGASRRTRRLAGLLRSSWPPGD